MLSVVVACLLLTGMFGAVTAAAGPASASGPPWSIALSPNPTGATYSDLLGVSCTSPTRCMAVGYSQTGSGGDQTLVESWNGWAWKIIPSPNSGTGSSLAGVSCTSPSRCTAVGYSQTGSGDQQTLVESWNGWAWSIVPSPNPTGAAVSGLDGVSCVSSTRCMAVGDWYTDAPVNESFSLVESWNGHTWKVLPSPSPGTPETYLNGVSCTSATRCTAVGSFGGGGIFGQTLVESWNGTLWSTVTSPSPDPTTTDSNLQGVSCTSSTRCTAVGSSYPLNLATPGGFDDQSSTLVESWDGTAWSIVSSPNNSEATYNDLSGVSCVSSTRCTAVGDWALADSSPGIIGVPGQSFTLVESWNGTAWSIVPSPNPTGTGLSSTLAGVSCTCFGCTAVGFSSAESGTASQTLIVDDLGW